MQPAATIPIAGLSERYSERRLPLIAGLLTLIGSQILFMLAPAYWVMCLARVIQGVSSSVVWVVGLALLCDVVPEAHIGSALPTYISLSGTAR
jgi:DHA1 family solute carrier family 18 vesicular amine transporter 1/2